MVDSLRTLFARDLAKLRQEISLYKSESRLWHVDTGIANSGGNLCLHLVGNLNAFIGVGLAGTDYVRNRDFEFSARDVPKSKLLQMIDDTNSTVEKGLRAITPEQWAGNFPITIWEKPTRMDFTLIHLYGHLSYHLGKVNYHRRLLDL